MNVSFTVKTPAFEGPLDLLLSLIEKRKLFINDVSLAKVTDDYIAHIKTLEQFPVADSAQFILIASTLLLIKSKSLLPALTLTEEEQGSMEDLETRLKLYKRYKELSVHIQERFGANIIFSKSETKNIQPVFSPEPDITPNGMLAALRSALQNMPKVEKLTKTVVKKVMSLEEMITSLTTRIQGAMRMSFKEFSGVRNPTPAEKTHIVVSFLAMLELVKQGIIHVTQEHKDADILMETHEVGVPRYN